ncbi:MAG: winged helix-turn-helix transcriptional regulator [Spirochaetia bacterium]|jgi:DNA-binding MarR family transcriptional regulator|nr:winged helix-turn-helix transcriptional regulator [Spirochaetia bacterium]
MSNNNNHETEITILENIHANSGGIRQRDLAEIAGLSLGMTNSILKRLAVKGLLTIKRVNNRNIHYIVTPAGIEAITRKSYGYFKRTIKNVVYYREAIENLVYDIKKQGYDGLILKGSSDLDFIVEHACRKSKLKYIKEDGINNNIFLLYSENYLPDSEVQGEDKAFLQSVLI